MPLIITGKQVQQENGIQFEALNSKDNTPVKVLVSEEFLEDFGESAVPEIASKKFDDGKFNHDGWVTVFTSDMD